MKHRFFDVIVIAVLTLTAVVLSSAADKTKPKSRPTAEYYVSPEGSDRNNGSRAHPWASPSAGEGRIEPGAVVHVLPGVYKSSSEMKISNSGLPAARIKFLSDVPWGAKLVSSASGNSTVVWIKGDYIDFEGFDVTGQGTMGIYVTGSNDRIIGNNVHDIPATGCKAGAGILNGNYKDGHDVDIVNNYVHDVGDYSHPCALVHGIYSSNRGGHILNNVVFRNQGWGIHTWHAATDVVIANNTVFNNAYGGIIIGAGDGPWTNDNSVVAGNIVYKNGLVPGAKGNGIEEYGKTGTRNRYVNNLVYGNGPTDWKLQNGNSSTGSIATDPQFVDYTGDSRGDYQLKRQSPARKLKADVISPELLEEHSLPNSLNQRIGADLAVPGQQSKVKTEQGKLKKQ